MGRKANAGELTPKHWKALQLIATNSFKHIEIAKMAGFTADYLYDLQEGDVKKCGPVATAFHAEVQKIQQELSKQIKKLTRQNKELVLKMLNERLLELEKDKNRKTSRELVTILNSLNKATPNVEIDQLNQFNSMSPEEIASEFRRLVSVAREFKRSGVPKPAKARAGTLPSAISARHRLLSESTDQDV